jgi:hypothetical protein
MLRSDHSISSPCDQPVALICRDLELLDGLLDRRLLIRRVIDDADELGRGATNVVGRTIIFLDLETTPTYKSGELTMVKKTKPEVRRASAKPVSEADAQLVPQQKIEMPKMEPAPCVEFDIGGRLSGYHAWGKPPSLFARLNGRGRILTSEWNLITCSAVARTGSSG